MQSKLCAPETGKRVNGVATDTSQVEGKNKSLTE